MKIATKKNLPFKEAPREYEASKRLTKTDKDDLQGQIKDLKLKV